MQKNKIKVVINGADANWNGKVLRKRTLVFEDDTTGDLTLFPDNEEVVVGQEIEYDRPKADYPNEIRIARAGGGKGGGFQKRSPHDTAMLNSNAIMKSMIESSQVTLANWKQNYVEAYKFFISFEDNIKVKPIVNLSNPTDPAKSVTPTPDDLPFDI